jgi:hypothetical protein
MYGGAQTAAGRRRYKVKVRNGNPVGEADLVVVVCTRPAKSCAQSGVMLARARPTGIFELLTAEAWARALGYPPDQLNGTSLRGLMRLEKPAARDVVAALLGESEVEPLEVTLRCKNQRRKRYRLYRRFDAYEDAVFVVADELVEERVAARPAYA